MSKEIKKELRNEKGKRGSVSKRRREEKDKTGRRKPF